MRFRFNPKTGRHDFDIVDCPLPCIEIYDHYRE